MPNKRKRPNQNHIDQGKRMTKSQIEKQICKSRLAALDFEESQTKDDRFSPAEREKLLQAYNEQGFQVFQDTKLLHHYFPLRRESDLKGLLQRFVTSLQTCQSNELRIQPLEEWEKLCLHLMGNFAKDKKINLDNVLSEALFEEANNLEEVPIDNTSAAYEADLTPDYPRIMRCFSSLLMGRFPDALRPVDALISLNLFNHVNSVVDSLQLHNLSNLKDGTWLEKGAQDRQSRQEMALQGLEEVDGKIRKCPTSRDIERNLNIEALCLELPKIKRITDVLNPLHINESLMSTLMKQ